MPTSLLLCFLFFTLSLLSLWIRKDPKVWGSFLILSLGFGLVGGVLEAAGLAVTAGWALLWFFYKKQKPSVQSLLFVAILVLSFGFKFHLFPGFPPFSLTPKFRLGLDSPLVGFFPLALFVPLAKSFADWQQALKGFLWGCLGIAIIAGLAVATGATHWQFKLPVFAATRYWANLFLTSIPEEGFYRGFIQNKLCKYLENWRAGKWISLILTSLLFTAAHLYWSPSIAVFAFVFIASLLYGGVYLISGKIESAILCHFLLNFIHMTFFSYHG